MTNTFLERGGLWVLGQSVLMLAVVLLGILFPGPGRNGLLMVGGGLLLVLGGAAGIAGMVVLGGSRTAYPKPPEQTRLVRHGIYAHIRHPLYTSVILAALGWALFRESWSAGLAALALGPFFAAKARREEEWLRAKFADYAAHERRVRRFIPGLY